MTLPVSDIVKVTILVSPSAPAVRGFGEGFILGLSTRLPLEERIREYTSLSGVAADFATSDQEYLAAQAWFGQTPAPSQPLAIGRRFPSGAAGHLRGSPSISSNLATFTAITNGGFDITINGTNHQIFALNFAAAANMSAVAAIIQTALNAALAGTTCVWTGTYFLITSPTTGTSSTVAFAAAPTGGSSPVDVSATLGLTQAAGALSIAGIAAESLTDSLNASALFNPNWYGFALTSDASTQDFKDAMAFAEAGVYLFFYTTNDPNALIASANTDLGSYAQGLGYNRTFGVYNSTSLYAAVSAMARLFVVDFTQPNSTITLKFKQLPGINIDTLTESQRLALDGKNLNFYTSFGGFAMIAEGEVANGRFVDEVQGLDWLQAFVQNAIFTVLTTTVTKVPQTDRGSARLVQAADVALAQARSNGLLAPGTWTGEDVGQVKSGDFLDKGYYVFATPVAQQSASDRAARKAPPITAIGIGAGAIQSANVEFIFQR
jgi:hypothetical protein